MDFSNHFMDAESFQSIFKHKTLVPVGPQTNFLTALTADGDLAGYINFEHNIDTETLYFISTETLVEYRNEGVLTQLLAKLMAYCEKQKICTLQVTGYTQCGRKVLRPKIAKACSDYNFKLIEEDILSNQELISRYCTD